MATLKFKNPSTGEWESLLAGTNGASAYEIAVKNGFTGTEAEWLTSLNGSTASVATQTVNGLMSAEDKVKLDGMTKGAANGVAELGADGKVPSTQLPTIPTNNNQLTNGAGYITGITKAMVTTALGYTPPTTDTNSTSGSPAVETAAWRDIYAGTAEPSALAVGTVYLQYE